ncbi:MAG: TolC family outer membrane protein [Gammaproteobacteria bacterium]
MYYRAIGMLCPALALVCGAALAQERPQSITDLLGVCNDALQFNAGHRAARAQYEATRALVAQARGKLLPQLGLRGQYDWLHESIEGDYYGVVDIDRDDGFERGVYGAQLQQALYRPELTLGSTQADLRLQQATQLLRGEQDALLMHVVEAYFGVLAAEDAVAFARAESTAVGEQLDQIRARAASGLATEAEVKAALAEHELAIAAEAEALDGVANATTRLEALTGRRYGRIRQLPRDLRLAPPQPADESAWITRAERTNARVQAQRLAVEIAGLEHDKARKLSWPTLDLVGAAYMLDASGGISGERDETQERVGVVLNLPLYSGGQISATKRQTLALQASAQALLDETLAHAERDVRIAYRNSSAGLLRVNALKRAVDAAIAAEAATRAGFDAGTRSNAEVLEAVERRFAAERDHAGARYKFLINALRLKQLSGNLLVADLAQINRMLQAPPATAH